MITTRSSQASIFTVLTVQKGMGKKGWENFEILLVGYLNFKIKEILQNLEGVSFVSLNNQFNLRYLLISSFCNPTTRTCSTFPTMSLIHLVQFGLNKKLTIDYILN